MFQHSSHEICRIFEINWMKGFEKLLSNIKVISASFSWDKVRASLRICSRNFDWSQHLCWSEMRGPDPQRSIEYKYDYSDLLARQLSPSLHLNNRRGSLDSGLASLSRWAGCRSGENITDRPSAWPELTGVAGVCSMWSVIISILCKLTVTIMNYMAHLPIIATTLIHHPDLHSTGISN